MVFYWQKRFIAEYFGETTIRVECNNCGTEYFYELRRVGSGSELAPYSIGGKRASRSAVDQSHRDLSRRMTAEAELVPCPKCNWINKDLVRGYQSGRFRRLTTIAFCIGFFGTAGSLIAAACLLRGPAADRSLQPYLLVGGPAVSLSLAALFVLLRVGLLSLIRPNRRFPRPPHVPRGTPRALIKDPQSGKLKPVLREEALVHSTDNWQEFRLGRDGFPPICCACGGAAEDGSAYKCLVTKVSAIEIPRCKQCAKRATRKSAWISCLIIVPAWLVTNAVAFHLGTEPVAMIFVNLFALIPLVALAAYFGPWSAAPVRTNGRELSRGITRLRFRNRAYAELLDKHLRNSTTVSGTGTLVTGQEFSVSN